jgi:hypothetical protein
MASIIPAPLDNDFTGMEETGKKQKRTPAEFPAELE